ncbi:MAG: efflux RND transporter permease subunit [Gammaproteobacteria bacterium]|nr:efflux RND transporter permease subunit [Gammaproteobacteria bacterium]
MTKGADQKLGFSGHIAQSFLQTEITLLLALLGLLLGLFAVLVTPREEEPQINVTFANVFIAYPGASAREVESLVSVPAEQVLSEIEGIKHVYSVSTPGLSVLTVEYQVGEDRTQAIVRLYNKIFSNEDWLPQGLGIGQPIIKPKGIDDVPIVALTLWTDDEAGSGYDLLQVAHALEAELKRVPGTREIYTIGGAQQVVHVKLDPQKLAAYGLTLNDLRAALSVSNVSTDAGTLVADNNEIIVTAGRFLTTAEEVAKLVVTVKKAKPVYLQDVATISFGPAYAKQHVFHGSGLAQSKNAQPIHYPALTLAVNKKPGTNAVDIANAVVERMAKLEGIFLPEGVNVSVTRNYGKTADSKAKTLITKLVFATSIVVLLVFIALGGREAFIVGTAVVITLAITLFASWAWGFTLNRVSLFALIFSIGILVDDAIVVVENIHRHMSMGNTNLLDAIPKAVDEVGGPTILATFTVIAALLPMAFVTGLMGPYMSPIPINASMGMLISLAVAFVITPWMCNKFLSQHTAAGHATETDNKYNAFFTRLIGPFLDEAAGKKRRIQLALVVLALITLSMVLVYTKHVVLKMLPFDNKSEFQIVVDMPEGAPLELTTQVLDELGAYVASIPEVTDYQIYSGTAAPINFNGLVRQYYLRAGSNVGDIQVNLLDKSERDKKSHEIAQAMRIPLQQIAEQYHANVKVIEVPPGPPVMSPLVAEVYGLDYSGQVKVASQVRQVFESTPDIVDVDDTIVVPSKRIIVHVDRDKAALLGISQQDVNQLLRTLLQGDDMAYLHGEHFKYAVPIRVELPLADKSAIEKILSVKLRGNQGAEVALADIVRIEESIREQSIYHKDLLPVVFVTGDMSGELDSPLYGMLDMMKQLDDKLLSQSEHNPGSSIQQYFITPPDNPYEYSMKWDGEWQITYETFRDMGIAYSIGLLLIYLLVVAQFRSYIVPLIIMAPIPLTIIGVMPGHAVLGAKFTATSMIGMIALAGIIVRNSILLVDFINEQLAQGMAFREAVIQASAVRSKPIVLTALAAMMGALFILDDPIFSGLAISLIFGILVATLLTLLVIPVMYYAVMRNKV